MNVTDIRQNSSKSILCASMHKAGSTIADKILVDFCTMRGLLMDRISLIVPSSPLSESEIFINYQDKMEPVGFYYGVARGPYVEHMPKLWELKIIVQVRDPRDCITSAYFSFRQSHVPPKDPSKRKEFMKRRKSLIAKSIDDYAPSQAGSYRTRLQILRHLVENHNDILLLKYEDMVLRTDKWLAKIVDFIEQPLNDELRATLDDKINFSVDSEEPSRHKRQVAPGDHKRKMAPSTIKVLNSKMAEQMAFFGYVA